jgi:hypothetical protein
MVAWSNENENRKAKHMLVTRCQDEKGRKERDEKRERMKEDLGMRVASRLVMTGVMKAAHVLWNMRKLRDKHGKMDGYMQKKGSGISTSVLVWRPDLTQSSSPDCSTKVDRPFLDFGLDTDPASSSA